LGSTSTTGTLNTNSASLSGILDNDNVFLVATGATATFLDRNVGTAVPVTVAGLSISGADAGNYTLTQPTGLTGNITQSSTMVTLSSVSNLTVFGQVTTIVAQVATVSPGAGQPTGTVTPSTNGTAICTAAVNPATGQATFSSLSIPFGILTVQASYSGDTNFQTSQSPV
jgi:hypothetical protein